MGLDTTHGCFHGSYSSFSRWRNQLAKLVGVPLALMDGHCDPDHFGIRTLSEWLPISWEILKPDPLFVLLHHSDCDGVIESKDCGPLADRLEGLLPRLEGILNGGKYWAVITRRFVAGLRFAAERGEDVEFH